MKEKLILFFTGWGMDENSVKLEKNNYDLITLFDYKNINTDFLEKVENYKEIYIIAWSMGVIFASYFINKIKNVRKSIAINGTLKIIDDKFGINTKIFDATLKNLNKNTINDFFNNMGYSDFLPPKRDFNNQLEELKFIKDFYFKNNFNANFDKIIIGKKDIIIPFKNQKRYWENNNIVILDSDHYVFNLFNSWEDIINVQ